MNETHDFIDFLKASPSSFHAAGEVARRLAAEGFRLQAEDEPWDASPGGHVMVRGGAVMAWWVPEDVSPETSGFRILGSHTDSPGLMLKPEPDIYQAGWHQAAVEIYGGPILASWFDRELMLAGQVVLGDGSTRLVATGPLLRVPHLAIHLYRENGITPDRQLHMQPIVAAGKSGGTVLDMVAESIGDNVQANDIISHSLITVPSEKPELFGAQGDLLAAARLDNLTSVYASLQALITATSSGDITGDILVLAAFDNEEVGSGSVTGAAGPILENVLRRTAAAIGADTEDTQRMFARSRCVSADATHSVHPNYVGKHDPTHHPIVGSGPVTKVNANMRYASSALSTATWIRACQGAGVSVQKFVSNNDVPCGSTIGPITATRLGIDTVDVGVPLLSMHSAREMCGVDDLIELRRGLESYLISR